MDFPKIPFWDPPFLTTILIFKELLIRLAPWDRQHPEILHAGVKKKMGCPPGTFVFFRVIANLYLKNY